MPGSIRVNERDISLLARLMRAEAEGDGDRGMLLVGNVGVNRVRSNCLDFKNVRSIPDMVFQKPGGFECVTKPYFYQPARERDLKLARRVVNGHTLPPAQYSLWFFNPLEDCPPSWYGQSLSGQYKNHCFYEPKADDCPNVFR